ncbi:MAG: cytidylate kinase-like family protein [Kiritimatiellae bacterium]|nr:cytidylate kinase-like family protein [Kiritimatiellia bacterium]
MDKKYIFTIGRQFGSGGIAVGKELSSKLGIPFYDSEILTRVAQESGFCEEVLKSHDEKPAQSMFYSSWSSPFHSAELPLGLKVFLAQFNVIKKIASEGPCVIVGRCADYVLKDYDNVVKTFIYASAETRVKNIVDRLNVTEKQARSMMHKADKTRTAYYNYFTEKEWGKPESYDMMIDTTQLTPQGAAGIIIAYSIARNSN